MRVAVGTVVDVGSGVELAVPVGMTSSVAVALGEPGGVGESGRAVSVVVAEDAGVGVSDGVDVAEEVATGVGASVPVAVAMAVAVGAVAVGVGVGVTLKGFSPAHSGLSGDPAAKRAALLGPEGGFGGSVNPLVS